MPLATPINDLFEAFFDLSALGGILFRPVQDAAGEVIDLAYERLNPAAQRMLALPECPAETFLVLYPHALTTGIFAFYCAAFRTGEARHGEFNYQYDGLDNYFHLAAQRVGERLLVSFTDTSEQPRSAVELALRESQAAERAARAEAERQRGELERVFEQAPLAIAVYRGPTYTIELANPTVARLWGRTREQLLGKGLFEALPEVAGLGYEELLDRVMATGVPHVAHAMEAQHDRNGHRETVYWDFVYVPMYAADGRIDGAMVVATEVTEQVRARRQVEQLNAVLETRVQQRTEELAALNQELTATNQELQQSNRQLTRTNVDLDTFVYTASHDLKAPITNIESITQALRETLPPAVQQDEMTAHLLTLLEQTTTRFQVTIDQLTDLSKLQLAHAGPAEPVNLAAVIESVRLDLAPAITAAHAQLTVEVAPDLLVSFSPANLRSAVYNLLSNAVKYRDLVRPAQVLVRAYPAGGRVVLEVRDNGLGLNAHQQSRLFGLFQRLHTHVEGTGVGLYTTKRLVENGGGTVAVASQVDAGTTFTLTFPA
ncbi:PAS domain-containing protein (plasmid) [Hymenobacter sp. BRD128]|uniref:sensor histidine kinase n=1 Tax=Hymenobacter sp. BRD128 TaxID=2675878 RepID=UPI0015665EC2|nr:ATP-binding protein [Hymenobacter sp. BRD128]QKG59178.1 PAS domain-containing protein [Hymenobacter sp. BRD128]